MGRRGPLPDSERLRALKGRRPGGRELTPRPVVPPEPEWGVVFPLPKDAALAADARVMRREARACWRLLVVELERSGAIAILDADILWRYSIARGRVVGAYRLLGREGLVVDGGRDGRRSHPAQRVIADCTRVLQADGDRLGLSPAARARLRLPPPADEPDEWAGLLDEPGVNMPPWGPGGPPAGWRRRESACGADDPRRSLLD